MRRAALLLVLCPTLTAPLAHASPLSLYAEDLSDAFAGEASGDYLYTSFTPGDLNSDGWEDLVVCGYLIDLPGSNDAGSCYGWFGPVSGQGKYPSVKDADFILSGELVESNLGYGGTTGRGDFNRDGLDDILLSVYGYNNQQGRVYLFYGRSDWSGITLTDADLVLEGEKTSHYFGHGVSSMCDLDD